MLDLKVAEVVSLPLLVLLADVANPEVVLLLLDAALVLLVVESISVVLEVNTVVDEIELDSL